MEPIFTFVVVIFFFGSFFIFSAVKSQIAMAARLRGKTLEVMRTFVNAIDMKDSYTKGHSEHIYKIVGLLHDKLPEELRQRINKPKLQDAAMLHDCGKISVKDEILNKVGPLTPEDWASIKTHPLVGQKMLDDTCFREISSWVLYHHERMDGKGYYGLPGADIPIEARMIAIADTYSALSTNRVYRRRLLHEDAVNIMRQAAGTQLDAELLECFLKIDPLALAKLLGKDTDQDKKAP